MSLYTSEDITLALSLIVDISTVAPRLLELTPEDELKIWALACNINPALIRSSPETPYLPEFRSFTGRIKPLITLGSEKCVSVEYMAQISAESLVIASRFPV